MKEYPGGLLQDWAVNGHDLKSRLVLLLFRMAQRASRLPWLVKPFGAAYLVLYRVLVHWIFGVELHWSLKVGPRLRLFHGYALVLHPRSVVGADCTLRHSTTLGTQDSPGQEGGPAPVLGDGVELGCSVVVLGGVTVGDGAVIGAGSVVVKDVPPHAMVVGNPARVIGTNPHPTIPASTESTSRSTTPSGSGSSSGSAGE